MQKPAMGAYTGCFLIGTTASILNHGLVEPPSDAKSESDSGDPSLFPFTTAMDLPGNPSRTGLPETKRTAGNLKAHLSQAALDSSIPVMPPAVFPALLAHLTRGGAAWQLQQVSQGPEQASKAANGKLKSWRSTRSTKSVSSAPQIANPSVSGVIENPSVKNPPSSVERSNTS
jgi:hypothetical protein